MKAFSTAMRGLIWQFAARDQTKMLSGLGRIHYVVVTSDKLKVAGRHPAWYVSQSSGEADLFVWGREDDGKVYFGGYCRGQEKMWHRKRCRVDQGERQEGTGGSPGELAKRDSSEGIGLLQKCDLSGQTVRVERSRKGQRVAAAVSRFWRRT